MNKKEKIVIAIIGLAQMALIGLRLGRVIDWHWAWVLGPTLFCAGLFTLIVFVSFAVVGFQAWFE